LGDLKAVKMLVERGADVNRKLPDHAEGWFSFHYSETDDHAKLRLEAEGHSPVVLATCGGHLEILKYLVSRGGKIITLTPDYTLLHAAAGGICTIHGDDGPGRRAVIRYLLDTGADINAVYYAGCGQNRRTTPLDMARRCGKTRTARFLEQHGARSSAGPTSRAASQPAGPAGGSDR